MSRSPLQPRRHERGRGGKRRRSICSAACTCPTRRHIGQRYPHQVSGGQLQRAMTAMAMSCRPDLIVFDEPTTALDVTTQIEVLAAIKDVVRQFNTAAIYITHDLAVVAQMADRIMVLRMASWWRRRRRASMLADAAAGLHASRSGPCARCTRRRTPAATACCAVRRTSTPATATAVKVLHDVSRRRAARPHGRGGRRIGLGQVDAGARHHRPAAAAARAASLSTASRCRPRSKQRTKDLLRRLQMIYQMPDTALNPRRRVRDIIGRPLQLHLGLTGAARERARASSCWR